MITMNLRLTSLDNVLSGSNCLAILGAENCKLNLKGRIFAFIHTIFVQEVLT